MLRDRVLNVFGVTYHKDKQGVALILLLFSAPMTRFLS